MKNQSNWLGTKTIVTPFIMNNFSYKDWSFIASLISWSVKDGYCLVTNNVLIDELYGITDSIIDEKLYRLHDQGILNVYNNKVRRAIVFSEKFYDDYKKYYKNAKKPEIPYGFQLKKYIK